jgi:hypothetical protein
MVPRPLLVEGQGNALPQSRRPRVALETRSAGPQQVRGRGSTSEGAGQAYPGDRARGRARGQQGLDRGDQADRKGDGVAMTSRRRRRPIRTGAVSETGLARSSLDGRVFLLAFTMVPLHASKRGR